MQKKFKKSLFIFRRDLRLVDNTALIEAITLSEKVIPAFFLDPRQVEDNKYKSENAIQFMLNSLTELNQELISKGGKLFVWRARPEEILGRLLEKENIEAVFLNKDYTPFSLKRDKKIAELCKENSIEFYSFDDALINAPGKVLKSDGKPYTVFTPFFKAAAKLDVAKPKSKRIANSFVKNVKTKQLLYDLGKVEKSNSNLFVNGGRKEALKLLKRVYKLKNYEEIRNLPAQSGTTGLSAHNKFGTVSIREVYDQVFKTFDKSHTLISELYWRDFFTTIGYYFPYVYKGCFYKQYDKLEWENSRKKFSAWCEGNTGFPIVDAGMRELNTTGFMHNRVRMIVASFLTKDLHIDWRWGERYFAQKLVDYDPAVNNGNWQWAASTGCDAQPYFRIFNPWRQQERFDPDSEYIKRWVPELGNFSRKVINKLFNSDPVPGYPGPMVDHAEEKEVAENMYLDARGK